MTYLFDGINHPTVAQVQASGAVGCLMYGGTPGDSLGKDFTATQYATYKQAGLLTPFVFENTANDMSTGMAGGAAHADALLADLHNKGVLSVEPIGVTVDEHVTAANIPLAVQYQTGFYRRALALGWGGARGGYGFSEFLIAIHDALVCDWFWGAGSLSSLPPYTNIWQDNTGVINVGGSADDRDWILVPLPTGGDMSFDLNTVLPDPASVAGTGTVAEALTALLPGIEGKRDAGAVAIEEAQIDADVKAGFAQIAASLTAAPGGNVDVHALAAALAPLLPADATPAQIGEAVATAFAAHLAATPTAP